MQAIQEFESIDDLMSSKLEHPKTGLYDSKVLGLVYAVEFGNNIKIGSTSNINVRMRTLSSLARNYANVDFGRIAITQFCTNWEKMELEAHKQVSAYRIGTSELFDISFEQACDVLKRLETNTLTEEEIQKIKKDAEKTYQDYIEEMNHIYFTEPYYKGVLAGFGILRKLLKKISHVGMTIHDSLLTGESGGNDRDLMAASIGLYVISDVIHDLLLDEESIVAILAILENEDMAVELVNEVLVEELNNAI